MPGLWVRLGFVFIKNLFSGFHWFPSHCQAKPTNSDVSPSRMLPLCLNDSNIGTAIRKWRGRKCWKSVWPPQLLSLCSTGWMVRHTVLVGISQQIFALKFVIFQLIHLSFSGHTQFTEILHPLSSQLVLSDGHQMFYFALGQLNTIAINIDVEGPSTEWKEYDNFLLFSFQALIIHVQITAVWKVHSSYTMSSIKMSLNIVIKYCYSPNY